MSNKKMTNNQKSQVVKTFADDTGAPTHYVSLIVSLIEDNQSDFNIRRRYNIWDTHLNMLRGRVQVAAMGG